MPIPDKGGGDNSPVGLYVPLILRLVDDLFEMLLELFELFECLKDMNCLLMI